MSGSVSPLHDPERDTLRYVPPLNSAIERAREVLTEYAGANIHDHNEMLRVAVALDLRLRSLVAALDAEEGRTP
ncbi:hypothetical protein [Streptomyces zaomyceticus]|uniref:hypothetical protein n=1 Tax=Streptomyces zaomyceticus TaxID=68286 RepID=UPI002E0EFB25|nr:hypothetical protein OG237_20315 [Streptomyces zaomyceticus]